MDRQIECFSLLPPREMRQSPRYRRWMGYAAMLDGALLIPIQAIDGSLPPMVERDGVTVHRGMGISFISIDWVLAQAIPPAERQAYENLKAHALEAYRTRPCVPQVMETPADIAGTIDNERDQDALLDWFFAVPGRMRLVLEDRGLDGMKFQTSEKGARLSPAAFESLMAHLESIGVDPKSREWKAADWN